MKIDFGKHKGTDITNLPDSYLSWGSEKLTNDILREAFTEELRNRTIVSGDSILKEYTIVETEEQRFAFQEHLHKYDILAFDTETTGLNTRKDEVIGLSVSGKEGVGYYLPLLSWNGNKLLEHKDNFDIMESVAYTLEDKKLLTWNGSFDVRMFKSNFGVDLTNSLYAEGMLLKHLIQEEGPFKLKGTGIELQEKIGLNVEEDANIEQIELAANIQKNGGSATQSNYELYKADLDVLGKYACADADLTLRICNYYMIEVEKQGLSDFFFKEEVMPLYKEVTVPMEMNGVALDMELLNLSKKEIEKDVELFEGVVIDSMFKLDEVKEWYKSNLKKVSEKTLFKQRLVEFGNLDLPRTPTGSYKMSKAELNKLPAGEIKSYLLGEGTLNESIEVAIKETIFLQENDNKKLNLSSKNQLGDIIFNYLDIKPLSHTKKGKPQFDKKFIEHLGTLGLEWSELLTVYNKLIKIRGSYIDRFLDSQENGKYYFSYKQHGTISGRYGSDAQQLPRPLEDDQAHEVVIKYTNRIRKFFVPSEGRIFIDADYESLEPHCVDKNSKVLTHAGYKKIKDIDIGDNIHTKHGLRRVLNKWDSDKKTLEIVTKKGVLRCSPDHKVFEETKGWTKAGDLVGGDVLEESKTFLDQHKYKELPLYLKGADKAIGHVVITEEKAWMLGAFLGDGVFCNTSTKYVGICGLEQDGVVDRFKEIIESMGASPKRYEDFRTEGMVSHRCHDAWLTSIFEKTFDLADKRGKLLHIPIYILNSPRSCRLSFLAGLIDTDGTYNNKKSELSISTKSAKLASDICMLGNTLGLDGRIGLTHKGVHKMYQVRFTTVSINLLVECNFANYIVCKRKRVFTNRRIGKKESPKPVILEINELENSEMVDITVDGNEEFICDNLRVHNCFAHVSGDEGLRDIFRKGHDFYSTIAIDTEGLDQYSADKEADNYLGKMDKQKRQDAKAYSLGVPYGMGGYALGKTLDIPTEKADALIEKYLKAYPKLKSWMNTSKRMAQTKGYVVSEAGRVRHLDRVMEIYAKYKDSLMNFKVRNKLIKELGKEEAMDLYKDYKNGVNNSKNFQIQSMAASIVNKAAIAVNKRFKELGIDGYCCAQIHDQLIFDVPKRDVEQCREIVRDLMENTTKLSLDLKAPPETGYNWSETH